MAIALSMVVAAGLYFAKVPLPKALPALESSKIFAADGSLIGLLHAEQDRTVVTLGQISKSLQRAVVATEDRDFFSHPGVSPKGILRAIFTDVRSGHFAQGGSTITQQYVRNAFASVGKERTFFRKIREAAVAVKLEREYSKDRILELYLNTVYFGRGAYGAEAAARAYFEESAADLTLSQSAYLAGVIRAPERFQPDTNPKRATSIRNEVLDDMVKAKVLGRSQAGRARKEALEFSLSGVGEDSTRAAFFVEYVRRQLGAEFGLSDAEVFGGGLEVHTTLEPRMQQAAEAAVSSTLDKPDDPEVALVAMDTQGNVKAMVGGRDVNNPERARQFNFAYQKGGKVGGRQAGSAFKPFTLAGFVDEGLSVNSTFTAPGSVVIDSKQCQNKDGTPWDVSNFDVADHGSMNVVEATVGSVNTVYAQMVDRVGPLKVARIAKAIGIQSDLPAVCSIALGTLPVTPLEMARAFATFAARGDRPDIVAVTKITGKAGKVIAEPASQISRVVDQNVADTVNLALQEVIKRGTGKRAALGRPAAGKTGTTENHVDAWFVGYTPDLVAVVWMGFPPKDGKIPEMTSVRGREAVGGDIPATIWKKFMAEALKGRKATSFASPTLGGEVISPSPTPCAAGATPPAGYFCGTPSPSPASPPSSPSPTSTPPSPSPSSATSPKDKP